MNRGTSDVSASDDTGESYDLVVGGAGLSGLAAAHFFRKPQALTRASSFSTTTTTLAATPNATSSSTAAAS